MKFARYLILGLTGAAMLAFTSCSSTSKNNQEYQVYEPGSYGDFGNANNSNTNYATNETGVGGGTAYPINPDYGSSYGPSTGGTSNNTSSGGSYTATNSGQTHTVQRGDNLYRISLKYGTTVANIKAANGLTNDIIKPGDVLVVR